mgnify:CR=1 FL=1
MKTPEQEHESQIAEEHNAVLHLQGAIAKIKERFKAEITRLEITQAQPFHSDYEEGYIYSKV